MQGGAAALFDALDKLRWAELAADVFRSKDGVALCIGNRRVVEGGYEADFALVRRFFRDDLEQFELTKSQLAEDFGDIKGLRGFARKLVMWEGRLEEDGRAEVGDLMDEETVRAAKLWRRGESKLQDGYMLPWLLPVTAMVRAAGRRGWGKSCSVSAELG